MHTADLQESSSATASLATLPLRGPSNRALVNPLLLAQTKYCRGEKPVILSRRTRHLSSTVKQKTQQQVRVQAAGAYARGVDQV